MSWQKKIKNETILEDYKKRFSQILEYTMTPSILGEDGDVDDDVNGGEEEMQPNGNDEIGMEQGSDTENMDAQQGGEQFGQDSNMPDMGGMEDMQGDMSGMPQDDGEDLTSGFNPEQGMDDGMDTMQPDDEVIDITDLTDAQEETQENVEEFADEFKKAFGLIKSLEKMLNSNSSKIEELENELKKRNPTPMEKMSNRAANSYPFNVSPKEYWDEKEKTSNYSTEDDNNGADDEYTITVGDVSGSDWKSISDSIDDDFLHNQTLNNILKF